MAYLELKNVSFQYPNGYMAIENLNLSFEKGEKAAIIGQNGAGKTTAAKLMNGLLRPVKGEVLVGALSTKAATTANIAKKVGYVFQNPDDQIFQDSIYKEIAFGLSKMKMSKDDIRQRVEEAAKFCGLEDVLQEHPYNLSYSRRRFITIAAIIVMNPQAVILDEPTAGQDKESTKRLGQIIDGLSKQNKIVITITHDMEFAAREFKRVIVMSAKQKRKDASPKEIFWDQELLECSGLKQPYICQLANLLGYKGVLTIDDLIEETKNDAIHFN